MIDGPDEYDELVREQEKFNTAAVPWELVEDLREIVNATEGLEDEPTWLTRRNAIDEGRDTDMIIRDEP